MHLKKNKLLKNREYKIEKVLGQGGFGITYLAVQVGLNRKVAVKEFYMKEYCERNGDASTVSMGTSGSRELVEGFKNKFVKEAQNIASFNHNNIIRIHDIFEENGTAYYVMEYHDCGSLSDYVTRKGRLSEEEAMFFIRQIADALAYIHKRKVNHLDVKPGNILLDEDKRAILIDFGLSKHYDEVGGQTTNSPVGRSKGYAPMEQYKQGGVSQFSPSTDIYSLGATMYKLVTGETPAEADEINEDGLSFPADVVLSDSVRKAIEFAMQPKRKDRPQSIEEFLRSFEVAACSKGQSDEATVIDVVDNDSVDEETVFETKEQEQERKAEEEIKRREEEERKRKNRMKWIIAGVFVLCFFIVPVVYRNVHENKAAKEYDRLIREGDSLLSLDNFSESIAKYNEAKELEDKYKKKRNNPSNFNNNAKDKLDSAKKKEDEYNERVRKQELAQEMLELVNGAKWLRKDFKKAGYEDLYDALNKYEFAKVIEYSKDIPAEEGSSWESIIEFCKKHTKENIRGPYSTKGPYSKDGSITIEFWKKHIDKFSKKQEPKIQQTTPAPNRFRRIEDVVGTINGHDYVDLGLPSGLKWATCNVGANKPEDYGDYFAWGETETKTEYSSENSLTREHSISELRRRGIVDGNNRLTSSYDAARAKWGGSWRMPTKEELEELENKCTWTWTTQNGVKGYKVTGPNGKSIFLPAAGRRYGTLFDDGNDGDYWSSTPSDFGSFACLLYFYDGYENVDGTSRITGLTVRPITE